MATRKNHTPQGGHIIGQTAYHAKDYGKGEGYAITEGTDDLTALVNLGLQSLKRGVARYPNTQEGLEALRQGILGYFQYINDHNQSTDEKPVFPDVEGLCMFLRITRKTLSTYEARGGEWGELIGNAKTVITAVKKQLADTFRIPPILAIFDLCNNAGYVNSSEFRLSPEAPKDDTVPRISEKELKRIANSEITIPEE